MAGDFFPRKDGAFVAWSASLRRHIVSAPEQFGLTESDVLSYAALDDELALSYAATSDKAHCTRADTFRKNVARQAVEEAVRGIAAQVKGLACSGVVTSASVLELGLNPRGRGGRHAAIGAPDLGPEVSIVSSIARRIDVRISDKQRLHGRARPKGTKGAFVWTFAGDEPSRDMDDWRYRGIVIKPTATFTFASEVPNGSRVWVRARWFTASGKVSPMSTEASINLPGDCTVATPKAEPAKIAA